MERYLIFDESCCSCQEIGRSIVELAAGKLEPVDIHSDEAQALLAKVYGAEWTHQPYLVTVGTTGDLRVSTDLGLILRLAWLLGPRKMFHVGRLARRMGIPLPFKQGAISTERRGFLKRSVAAAAGLLLAMGTLPRSANAFNYRCWGQQGCACDCEQYRWCGCGTCCDSWATDLFIRWKRGGGAPMSNCHSPFCYYWTQRLDCWC